ncbi:MAG: PH domain-containing protein [Candidatus Muiribacteriota bacterium]
MPLFILAGILGLYLLFFIFTNGLRIIFSKISYDKEKYYFKDNKIMFKFGGVFDDAERELKIKNITNVRMKYPWLEYKFLNTGTIYIKSAGTNQAEIVLKNIDNVETTFNKIKKLMDENGFQLKEDKLIQKETPDKLGSLFETGFIPVIPGLIIKFIVLALILNQFTEKYLLISFLLVFLNFLYNAVYYGLKYYDYSMREYKLYNGLITFSEGFLTKHEAFIPVENITNTSINQELYEKFLKIHDIIISCKGTNNQIKFKNMHNSDLFHRNLESVLKDYENKEPAKGQEIEKNHSIEQKSTVIKKSDIKSKSYKTESEDSEKTNNYTATLKPNFSAYFFNILFSLFNTFLSILILFVLFKTFVWKFLPQNIVNDVRENITGLYIFLGFVLFVILAGIVSQTITLLKTVYYINKSEIKTKFDFLSSRSQSFYTTKITAVTIKEGIIDRLFNTCSIYFSSVGSMDKITFLHINRYEVNTTLLMQKCGMDLKTEKITTKSPSFTVFNYFCSKVYATIINIIFIIFASALTLFIDPIFAGLILLFIVSKIITITLTYYKYDNSKIDFYSDFIKLKKGFLSVNEYFFSYDNIKDTAILKYPFGKKGIIYFNLAGEGGLSNNSDSNEGNKKQVVINNYSMEYISEPEKIQNMVDKVFLGENIELRTETVRNGKYNFSKRIYFEQPHPYASIISLIIFSIFFFPMFPLLILTIPLTLLHIKKTEYILQEDRIVSKWGIFYTNRLTILYSKIDHLDKNENIFNKMFQTGNIWIYTTGSNNVELAVNNIKNHNKFYKMVEEQYK